jgi:hypothetical protein
MSKFKIIITYKNGRVVHLGEYVGELATFATARNVLRCCVENDINQIEIMQENRTIAVLYSEPPAADTSILSGAVRAFLAKYEESVNSGDWGNWSLEDDPEYQAVKKALDMGPVGYLVRGPKNPYVTSTKSPGAKPIYF